MQQESLWLHASVYSKLAEYVTALNYLYMHLCIHQCFTSDAVTRYQRVLLLEQANISSGDFVLAAAEKQKCGKTAAGGSRRDQG